MKRSTIREGFELADSERRLELDRLRELTKLSKPWLLPPLDYNSSNPLPNSYQSVVARGLTAIEGQALVALYPPSDPWFLLEQSEIITNDPDADPEVLAQNEQLLLAESLIAASQLESENEEDGPRDSIGFRTAKRQSLANVFALGDSLERLNDDYSLQTFRLTNYTTCRDSAGRVLYHHIREKIDPLSLSEEMLSKSGLDIEEYRKKYGNERLVDSYTRVQWQPDTRTWVETQEINERVVRESEERVTRYISTPFELAPDDHYGHGLVELYRGDIYSLDKLSEKIIDFAAIASKILPVIDTGSEITESDMVKPSGSFLRGRVVGGVVQDVGFIQVNKLTDFKVIQAVRDSLRGELGAAMLVGSQGVRDSERTTATEVMQVNVRELESALGGFYAPIADRQQKPTVARLLYQCRRDKYIGVYPERAVKSRVLTGVDALARMEKMQRVLQLTQLIAQLGPEGIRNVNIRALVNTYVKYLRVSEPGLIKTNQQLEAEAQAAIAQATQAAAAQQAIQSTGNIIEQRATAQ